MPDFALESEEMNVKKVLINGGSRGIGAEAVRRFCAAGYSVAFTYRRARTEAETLARAVGAFPVQADSSSPAEVQDACRRVREEIGEIDILINNAAVSSFSLFTELTDEEWAGVFAVNVNGPFYYARALLPAMIRKKWGRIINVSSMWGISGASCEVHYSASKAALIGMSRALAKEVGPSGITVNSIAPGVIDTEMNAALSSATLQELQKETPLGRLGTPGDVAAAMLFLAGEEASFITGQTLSVDGGFLL